MIIHLTPIRRRLCCLYALLLAVHYLAGLTNSDVITLHNAGIAPDTIVLAINSAQEKTFDTSTTALVELKTAGLDETVIQAILVAVGDSAAELSQATPTPQSTVEKPQPAAEPEPEPVRVIKKTAPKPVYRPAPAYPEDLKANGTTGAVKVKFTVNAEGGVDNIVILESDHEAFSAAVRKAVSTWQFTPATEDGSPVASDARISIPFNLREQSSSSLSSAPKPLSRPNPTYPRQLRERGITGHVKVQCVIDESGNVADIQVVESDHELFTEEALRVLQKWKFAPAIQDGQIISSRVQFSIPFKIRE